MLTKPATRLAVRLYQRSPKENLTHWRNKWFSSAAAQSNDVLDELMGLAELPKLLAWKLRRMSIRRLVMLGDGARLQAWQLSQLLPHLQVEIRAWDWDSPTGLPPAADDERYLVAQVATAEHHWQVIAELREQLGASLLTLGELLLDFTRIFELQGKLGYCLKTPAEILPFYLGERYFGPLDELDRVFPLKGKSIVEFGPFDGCQTLGLLHLGAGRVTCIEARAENALKTQAAADALGFTNVRISLDDFHNAAVAKYGRYDLAFAHGVYYHSIAPFVFLNNLVRLADAVFLGGYCATDESPSQSWEYLAHDGETYRVKPYVEKTNFSAGVNRIGYYFQADELQEFFRRRGFHITVISDEACQKVAGKYLRFLARRP